MTDSLASPETVILAIAPEQNTAEQVQALLREAGHAARVDWLVDFRQLAQRQDQAPPALVCCRAQAGGKVLLRLVQQAAAALADSPVVALAPADDALRAALMEAGAADVADPDQPAYLAQVLHRELRAALRLAELRALRERVAQMDMRLDAILAESSEARAVVHDGILAQVNPVYARLFGFEDAGELDGAPLMDLIAPASRDAVKRKLAACLNNKDNARALVFEAQRADDSPATLALRCRRQAPGGDQPDENAIEVLVTRARSAAPAAPGMGPTPRQALYAALAQSEHDSDTRAKGLLFAQVDDTRALHARLGLPATDRLLDELAAALLEHLPAGNRVFRFASDQYVVLAAPNAADELAPAAERLRAQIAQEALGDAGCRLTASVAIAPLAPGEGEGDGEGDGDDNSDGAARLAQALVLAQQLSAGGGNRVAALGETATLPGPAPREQESEAEAAAGAGSKPLQALPTQAARVQTPAHSGDAGADSAWAARIETALQNGGFVLAYRAITSLEGGPGRHFEVSPRIKDAQGRRVGPEAFAAAAARRGLDTDIERWMLARALAAQQARGEDQEAELLFVPLIAALREPGPTANTGDQEQFADWLQARIAENPKAAAGLVLVLECAAVQANRARAAALCKQLKALGFKLALGNFGDDPEADAALDLAADYVKLSAAGTEAATGEDAPALVEALGAARKAGARVIAGPVESAHGMARLWQLGVNFVQGRAVEERG